MFRMFNFVRSRKNNVCAYIVCISRTRSRVGIPHSHEITIESCCTSRSVKISQPPEAFILQDWLCFKYICILTQFCDVHDGELYTSTRAQSALHKAEYFFCLGQRCCSVSPRLPSWLPSPSTAIGSSLCVHAPRFVLGFLKQSEQRSKSGQVEQ